MPTGIFIIISNAYRMGTFKDTNFGVTISRMPTQHYIILLLAVTPLFAGIAEVSMTGYS